jgi:hypothetical protein
MPPSVSDRPVRPIVKGAGPSSDSVPFIVCDYARSFFILLAAFLWTVLSSRTETRLSNVMFPAIRPAPIGSKNSYYRDDNCIHVLLVGQGRTGPVRPRHPMPVTWSAPRGRLRCCRGSWCSSSFSFPVGDDRSLPRCASGRQWDARGPAGVAWTVDVPACAVAWCAKEPIGRENEDGRRDPGHVVVPAWLDGCRLHPGSWMAGTSMPASNCPD